MTEREIRAYNAGVFAVLKIAHDAAEAIARTSSRHVHEDFAVAALAELVEAGKALFIPVPPSPAPDGTPVRPEPQPTAPAAVITAAASP